MRRDDPGGGGLPIGERQRQTVRHVRLDRQHKRLRVGAFKEAHLDAVLATQARRPEAVHSVDDPPAPAMNEDWRKRLVGFGEKADVLGVLTGEAR
jgi:hypothetical protein